MHHYSIYHYLPYNYIFFFILHITSPLHELINGLSYPEGTHYAALQIKIYQERTNPKNKLQALSFPDFYGEYFDRYINCLLVDFCACVGKTSEGMVLLIVWCEGRQVFFNK